MVKKSPVSEIKRIFLRKRKFDNQKDFCINLWETKTNWFYCIIYLAACFDVLTESLTTNIKKLY